jgi:hypothetical protein
MADIVADGTMRVSWVPTISNKNAPTVAELNAGIRVSSVMPKDGFTGFEPDTASVDNATIESTFDTQQIGTDSFGDSSLTLKKQDGTDTTWNTLVRGAAGYVVVRRYIAAATAWAIGQKVNVYPAVCGTKKEVAPEKNTMARYTVPIKITADPALDVAVA